ncbi:MAG: sigma-70 family RNA polymerase sigma factor [Planctomycetia bacterium]|nr:sigma-70 family RNA polymerase sigma factor [Planctomycetia bacterium]
MMALSDPGPGDFDRLYDRARAGDNAAWDELFQKCYPKVIRVVRRKLNQPLRSLYDSTDFASDVMKSLAANAGRLEFPSFESLIAFLVRVAEQKVIDEHRKNHTQKRDIDRQRRLNPDDGGGPKPLGLASVDPTASQLAVASEAHDRLMAGQEEDEREAIQLKQLGYSNSEIAQKTGWHPRKVQRFFKNLWDSWGMSPDAS